VKVRFLSLLLAITVIGGPVAAQTRVGDFVYVQLTDPMSDRDLTYISTRALDPRSAGEAHLLWRCSGPRLELVLRAPDLAGLSGPVRVRWRFDRGPASDRQTWRSSTMAPVIYAPETVLYPFSTFASDAATVLVRAEDGEGNAHDYLFSVRGLGTGLDRLACVRHLELLGQRRLRALYARTDLGAEAATEEDAMSRLQREFPFVGHRTQRRYAASSEACWQMLWDVTEVAFFRDEAGARASGYAKDAACSLQ
jgi:hypothetical protein